MKKLSVLTGLATVLGFLSFAAPALAFDHEGTYNSLDVPEYEVKLNGGSFLIFGFEYLEKANDQVVCAKTKAPAGIPSAYSCYTPTISGDAAKARYDGLSIEVALEYTQNGERMVGVQVDQKLDGLGFCRRVMPVVPGAEGEGVYTCYEPAR